MNILRWFSLVGALGLFACGGGNNGGAAAEGGTPANAFGSSVTHDMTAGASDPEIAYAVTITMASFTVPPNSEVWKCQDFANPFGGQQVDVRTWDFDMTEGSHHMTLFNMPGVADGPLVDCEQGVPNAVSYSFGAQNPKAKYTYPDGVGEAIPAGMGFTINSHYLNATASPIQATVVIKIFVAKPGVVTQHAGSYQGVLLTISVPPTQGQPVTVGSTCSLPQDMNVLAAAGHIHTRASHFVVSTGGKTLFETDVENSLPSEFSPPMQLKKGDDITWSCVYKNETDAALVYGPSALTNVMCNTVLTFYPVPDISNPIVSCFH